MSAKASPGKALAPTAAPPAPPAAKSTNVVLLAAYLFFWYALNVQYNLYNKKILNVFDFPYTTALVQLGSGLLYIIPKYCIFRMGKFDAFEITKLSAFHGGGHYATVMSLGAGSVAFANVVKSAEPFVSVLMGVLMGMGMPSALECASLVPIIAGVAIASMAEPEFSMLAFCCAMLSNFLFAARGTFAKIVMTKGSKENAELKKQGKQPLYLYSGSDLFAVNTIFAFLLMAPITLVMEGKELSAGMAKLCTGTGDVDAMALFNGVLEPAKKGAKGVMEAGPSPEYFIAYQLVCGLYYYAYNEIAFIVLDMLDPVGQAVGNTVKRVVVIIAGTIIFNKPLTTNGIIGSSVAIFGVLLYSLVKAGVFKSAPKAKDDTKSAVETKKTK